MYSELAESISDNVWYSSDKKKNKQTGINSVFKIKNISIFWLCWGILGTSTSQIIILCIRSIRVDRLSITLYAYTKYWEILQLTKGKENILAEYIFTI